MAAPDTSHIKKGALHQQLGIPLKKKIPVETLRQKAKSANETTRKRAQFALNARGWKH